MKRVINVKFVTRLRRTPDIEMRADSTTPVRRKLYIETKDRQDVSHYASQRIQAQANADDEMARD